jgi:hypothetical protein
MAGILYGLLVGLLWEGAWERKVLVFSERCGGYLLRFQTQIMMIRRAVWTLAVYVCAVTGALGQQAGSGGLELQKRQDATAKVEKAPPPAPVKAPETLEAAKAPNSNVVYQALRQRGAGGPSFKVKGLVLKRDAGEVQLNDGVVTLFNEVNGRVTGAVFQGQGVLHVEPPTRWSGTS